MQRGIRAGRGAVYALILWGLFFPAAAQEAETPRVVVQDGVARVEMADTLPLPGGRRLVRLDFSDRDAPLLADSQTGTAYALLQRLYVRGQAAGHHGDLYDNRDRAHSEIPKGHFPQLARVAYGEDLRQAGLDYGAALGLIFDAPVLGNSSTALTAGDFWRSQARFMLTNGGGPLRLYQNYVAGQIHIYPEHRDHDPEHGDLMPANTPYYLISQGSSGSDRAHMTAVAMILAAFRPDTKAMLRETGLLAPTVQMVYRRARANVLSRAAYESGAAHPSVFEAKGIVLGRMVSLANAISPDAVPPMVHLQVMEETLSTRERLFDTPAAVARVWRAKTGRHQMLVSAEATRDPNGRALQFTWAVLRGDPGRIRVEPLPPDGARARITLDWQDPRAVPGSGPGAPDLMSSRIDIGVFAHNGAFNSAPAFLSVLLPRHERRDYDVGAEGEPQLATQQTLEGVYADPAIYPAQ